MTIKEEKLVKNYIKGLVRESLFGGKGSKTGAIRSWSPEKEEPGRSIDDMLKSGEVRTWHREDEPERSIDDMLKSGEIRTWDKHRDGGVPEDDSDSPAGLDELRKLCESFAREAKENLFGNEEDNEDFDSDDEDVDFDDEYYEREDPKNHDYGIYELRKLCEGMARDAVKSMVSEGKKKGSKKSTRKSDGKKKGSKGGSKPGSQEKSVMAKLNSDGVNAASYYYKLYGAKTEKEKASARSKGYKKAKGKKNDSGARYRFTSKERNRLNSMLTDK